MKFSLITVYSIGHAQSWAKFLALLISFICLFNFYAGGSISKEVTAAAVAPTVTPTPDASNKNAIIELDRDSVSPKCPAGYRVIPDSVCGKAGMLIEITAVVGESAGDASIYRYTVSGGRVIGNGRRVTWDLTGAQPGTYTVKVDVEDESKTQNRTETKTITVLSDWCCSGDCFCPELSVLAPASPVQAGETMTFVAYISGGSADTLTFHWTVSKGKIIEGQGSPIIKVMTDAKMAGATVEATVDFGENAFCGGICAVTTASASGFVAAKKRKGK